MKAFKLHFMPYGKSFRKWEIKKNFSDGATSVVIKKVNRISVIEVTVYPYSVPKNKCLRYLKFKWLKLIVWLKVIK